MIIGVENFGPIKSGKVNFKPLTVFIGKNDYGKSYMAMLMYSMYLGKSELRIKLTPELLNKIIEISKVKKRENYRDVGLMTMLLDFTVDVTSKDILLSQKWDKIINLDEIYKTFFNGKRKSFEFELQSKKVKDVLINIIKKLYSLDFINTIEYCFSNDVKNLVKSGEKSFKIRIQTNKCSVEIMLTRSKGNKEDVRVNVLNLDAPRVKIIIKPDLDVKKSSTEFHDNTVIIYRVSPIGLYTSLTDSLLRYLELPSLSDACYYLPASRSGMILGLEAFISGIIERIPLGGISKIPGVVSDFLNEIKNISPETKSIFYNLGLELEREIGWTINLRKKKEQRLFDIVYKKGKKRYRKEHVSSGILEMSPFILYLKHVMLPFSTLIVEEPEAHIHPSLQRIFIKYLVKLVKLGVRVVVITHSDYILEQINTLIALSNLDEKKRRLFAEKRGYDPEDYLTPNEVSAYLFKIGEDGCTIEELEIDEDGILEDDFFKVREELYEDVLTIKKLKEGYI